MRVAMWFAFQAVGIFFYAAIVINLGIVQETFAEANLSNPTSTGNFLEVAADLIRWYITAVTFYFKFITFQVAGVPAVIGVPISLLMNIINVYLVYRALRSGTAI